MPCRYGDRRRSIVLGKWQIMAACLGPGPGSARGFRGRSRRRLDRGRIARGCVAGRGAARRHRWCRGSIARPTGATPHRRGAVVCRGPRAECGRRPRAGRTVEALLRIEVENDARRRGGVSRPAQHPVVERVDHPAPTARTSSCLLSVMSSLSAGVTDRWCGSPRPQRRWWWTAPRRPGTPRHEVRPAIDGEDSTGKPLGEPDDDSVGTCITKTIRKLEELGQHPDAGECVWLSGARPCASRRWVAGTSNGWRGTEWLALNRVARAAFRPR